MVGYDCRVITAERSRFMSNVFPLSADPIMNYLKLNDYKLNGINIFNLYMQSYKNKKVIKLNEKEINCSIIDNNSTSNIPILQNGHVSGIYNELYSLAHY